MAQSKTNAIKLTAAERRVQAVELRKGGATYEQIGRQIGVTRQAAYKTVMVALANINEKIGEDAEVIRTLELERLDKLWLAMYSQAKQGNQGAVDRCLRIMERRSRLLGLDMPTKVQQENSGQTTIVIEHVEKPIG